MGGRSCQLGGDSIGDTAAVLWIARLWIARHRAVNGPARIAAALVSASLVAAACAGTSQDDQDSAASSNAASQAQPGTTLRSGPPEQSPVIAEDASGSGNQGAPSAEQDGVAEQDEVAAPTDGVASPGWLAGDDGGPLPAPAWQSCGSAECATVEVPLDYANPDGPTTPIAIARQPASGDESERLGTIFVNFGGPGGEGVGRIQDYRLPGSLGERFDAVLWDVRGVGGSASIDCFGLTPDEPNQRPDGSNGFDDEVAVAIQVWDTVMDCVDDSPLVDHIGTAAVARDLDQLRRMIGEDQLNLIGFSYGSQIGWVYASLFPDTVGAMVLDGAVPPNRLAVAGSENLRYVRFEEAIERLDAGCDNVSACQQRDEGLLETIERLQIELEAQPLPLDDGEAFGPIDLGSFAVGTAYFDPERIGDLASDWLAALDAGDPEPIANFNELLSQGFDVGVFWSVICADGEGVTNDDDAVRLFGELVEAAPLTAGVGADVAYCHRFPGAIDGLPPIDTTGAPPLMVIGSTGDAATPYEWAVELDQLLDESALLTFDGGGHTVVSSGDECVTGHVERYFFDGTLPADGSRCGLQLEEPLGWSVPIDQP